MMGTMARRPVARDAVLDAFEELLIGVGERAATLEAVAKQAGVSKGGLLYHFPNKEALIAAMLERLDLLAGEDIALMAAAPEGAATYFIRTSLWSGSPMDRSFLAASRLAEVAHVEARRRFAAIQRQWLELIAADVGNGMAKAVLYMGDGLYLNAMWEGGAASSSDGRQGDVEALLSAVERLRG
jgi:AcrR family transcriptional regulator